MIALLLALLLSSAHAQTLERVARVVDGDSIVMVGGEHVRIRGVDSPEIHPCRCEYECNLGRLAQHWTALRVSEPVRLVRQGRDRYGRTLASVYLSDGGNLGSELIARGLARPYDGRTARRSWC